MVKAMVRAIVKTIVTAMVIAAVREREFKECTNVRHNIYLVIPYIYLCICNLEINVKMLIHYSIVSTIVPVVLDQWGGCVPIHLPQDE